MITTDVWKNDENKNIESIDLKKKLTNKIENYDKKEDKMVVFLKNLLFMEKYDDKKPNLIRKELNNILDDEYSKGNFD